MELMRYFTCKNCGYKNPIEHKLCPRKINQTFAKTELNKILNDGLASGSMEELAKLIEENNGKIVSTGIHKKIIGDKVKFSDENKILRLLKGMVCTGAIECTNFDEYKYHEFSFSGIAPCPFLKSKKGKKGQVVIKCRYFKEGIKREYSSKQD